MNNDEFERVTQHLLKKANAIMFKRAMTYSKETDRLANFRHAAGLTGRNMQQVLAGFMLKHTVSLYDMIETGGEYPLEQWEEKIIDHINYLILLRAVLEEGWSGMSDD